MKANGEAIPEVISEAAFVRPTTPEAAARPAATSLPITVTDLEKDQEVRAYIEAGNANLAVLGFTEHGLRHASLVSHIARNVLRRLGHGQREQELAAIAGYLHDIGNAISRYDHSLTGALLAREILRRYQVAPEDIAIVMGAIGSHGDDTQRLGEPVHAVSAALILADKSDVHRSRVQNPDRSKFDQHDRVNYAAVSSFLRVDPNEKAITLELTIDTTIAPVMHYFEIFLPRMLMSARAAEFLGCAFHININGVELL
jgi:metal-dependent HD superfamily phosphatase/phosphodiesterase